MVERRMASQLNNNRFTCDNEMLQELLALIYVEVYLVLAGSMVWIRRLRSPMFRVCVEMCEWLPFTALGCASCFWGGEQLRFLCKDVIGSNSPAIVWSVLVANPNLDLVHREMVRSALCLSQSCQMCNGKSRWPLAALLEDLHGNDAQNRQMRTQTRYIAVHRAVCV